MKNYKIKKTMVALSFLSIASLATFNAHAIPVNNINDPIFFGPVGIFTMAMGRMLSSVKGSVDSVRETANVAIAQKDAHQQNTDQRNRLAAGIGEMYKRDLEQIPTIQQCVELTNKKTNSSAVAASSGGGGGGGKSPDGKPKPGSKEDRLEKVKSIATSQAALLEKKPDLGTCNGGMDLAVADCGKDLGKYAGGDISMFAITSNIEGKDSKKDFANFSMNEKGFAVAEKYANDATLYDAPRSMDPLQAAKNPLYVAMYNSIISKLYAANDAILNVARIRVAPPQVITGAAGDNWKNIKGEYTQTLGLKAPEVPSLFEMLYFYSFNDFAGPNSSKIRSVKEVQEDISRKLTLANVIAIKQLQTTETANILLAHMLAQSVTPLNIQAVHAENAKTLSAK